LLEVTGDRHKHHAKFVDIDIHCWKKFSGKTWNSQCTSKFPFSADDWHFKILLFETNWS